MSEIVNLLAQSNTVIKERAVYLQKVQVSKKMQQTIDRYSNLVEEERMKLEAATKEDELLTKYTDMLDNYSKGLNEFMEGKCRHSRRRSIGKVNKKSEVLVPDISNCNEFVRQLSQERILDRLSANWAKTIEQLKKLKDTAVRIQARYKELPEPLQLSMFSKNELNSYLDEMEPRN